MKKVIYVCGTARSGSTLLDLMLGNAPDAFSLGEVFAWFRPFRTHHFQINCSCSSPNCPWHRLKHFPETEFYERSFKFLGVNTLIDSSKNIPWIIDGNIHNARRLIITYNVLLYKDPLSHYYSFWKRGYTIREARKAYISYYKRFFDSGLPYIAVNYNRLVASPASTLEKLCHALDLDYFPGKERFWEKQHHQIFGSLGTRRQVEKGESLIRRNESYPHDFERLIPSIRYSDENNTLLRSILVKLNASDLIYVGHSGVIRKPAWYYLLRMKYMFRRYFPEHWKHNQ